MQPPIHTTTKGKVGSMSMVEYLIESLHDRNQTLVCYDDVGLGAPWHKLKSSIILMSD